MLQPRDFNRRITNAMFDYYRCKACSLIFLSPIPDNLSDYYPPSYYQFPPELEDFASLIQSQQYKVDLVQQFMATGRLLEIGPGPGDFALLMKRAGFAVDTIEMDERCCQFLREVINVNAIHNADTLAALQPLGQYDVIALWQVIEHLPNPWSVLDALIDHIAPGGILVIAAPNPYSLQFRLFRRFWTHIDAPRHLELIPTRLLTQRLESHGLRPVLRTTTDPGSLGWNTFGWHMSLRNLFSNRAGRFNMRVPARIIEEIMRPVERTGLRGSTYTLIFQR